MSTLLLTPKLIERIEGFHLQFNRARMEALAALPGNPYDLSIARFGDAWAFRSRSPLLRGKNRIGAFTEEDLPILDEALGFFRREGLPCSLGVPYGRMTRALFEGLAGAGLWSGGSGTVPCADPADVPETAPGIEVAESGAGERDLYLDLFAAAFAHRSECDPAYRPIQWSEDSLPSARRYIARIDGEPVGMASLIHFDRVGLCATAGVLPAFRGRGIQTALIGRRFADAAALGCDLILGGGMLFSTTHRNFERAGMRLAPLGMGWTAHAPLYNGAA